MIEIEQKSPIVALISSNENQCIFDFMKQLDACFIHESGSSVIIQQYVLNNSSTIPFFHKDRCQLIITSDEESANILHQHVLLPGSTHVLPPIMYAGIYDDNYQSVLLSAGMIDKSSTIATPKRLFIHHLQNLLTLTPQVKKIMLLPNEEEGEMVQFAQEIFNFLSSTHCITIGWYNDTYLHKERKLMKSQNLIINLQRKRSASFDQLAAFCSHNRILLYNIGEMDDEDIGINMEIDWKITAQLIAQIATQLFINDNLYQPPSLLLIPPHIKIRFKTLEAQGLSLFDNPALMTFLSNTKLHAPSSEEKVQAYKRLLSLPLE